MIKKNIFFGNKGFGLVETFLAAGVGFVLGLGVLKISQIALRSAQISGTQQAEQDLYVTIRQMLSDGEDCKWNLDPKRLSDTSNKNGKLINPDDNKLRGFKKTNGTPNDDTDDIPYLELGDFKSGLISVKSLELLNTGSPPNLKWTFAVYYTKPQLGSNATLENAVCSTTDKTGCYHQTCNLNITHILDPNNNTKYIINSCSLLNCYSVGGGLDVSCEDGQYLHTFDAEGNEECKPISPCPQDKVYVGNKEDGTPDCRVLPELPELENSSCHEAGKVLQGFNKNGKPICRTIPCPSGKVYNKDTSTCECSSSKPYYYRATCNQCPAEKPHFRNNICNQCPETRPHYYNNQCNKCSSSKPYYYGSTCHKCPAHKGFYWSGKCHKCPSSTPYYYFWRCHKCLEDAVVSNNQCCTRRKPYYYNNRCNKCREGEYYYWNMCSKCPQATPHYYNNQCNKCNKAIPYYYNNMCNRCPSHKPYYDWRCTKKCHRKKPEFDRQCNKCPPNYRSFLYQCLYCPDGWTYVIGSRRCYGP